MSELCSTNALSCVVVRGGQDPVVVNLDLPDVEPEPERVERVDDLHPGSSWRARALARTRKLAASSRTTCAINTPFANRRTT